MRVSVSSLIAAYRKYRFLSNYKTIFSAVTYHYKLFFVNAGLRSCSQYSHSMFSDFIVDRFSCFHFCVSVFYLYIWFSSCVVPMCRLTWPHDLWLTLLVYTLCVSRPLCSSQHLRRRLYVEFTIYRLLTNS